MKEIIRELLSYLPDGGKYKWVWEECTDEEQGAVKEIRAKYNNILAKLEDKKDDFNFSFFKD